MPSSLAWTLTSPTKGPNVRTSVVAPLRLVRRRSRVLVTTAATAALAISMLPLATTSAYATITTAPVVTFSGSVGTLPASTATVTVQAQLALNVNSSGVPQQLEEVPVASATITSPALSIPVPDSASLQQAELQGHGIVNFDILVTSGTSQTSEFVPAALTASATAANAAQLTVQKAHQVQVPAFPAFHAMSAGQEASAIPNNGGYGCFWSAYGSEYQDRTRIGEAHVANVSGVSDTFWFKTQNDMTISVGLSYNGPGSGYTPDGNITLTNSLSANGSDAYGSGAVNYVNDTTNYQRYQLLTNVGGHPCNQWMVQAVGSDADVYPGTNTPPVNPWGGCRNDPLYATLAPGATWERDQSSAEYYSIVAQMFGFTFGGSDGFTQDIEHDYDARGAGETTYICGNANGEDPTQAPILYNTP